MSAEERGPGAAGEWVAIGVLTKARGNRGELAAIALAGRPERFEALRRVWLCATGKADSGSRCYEVENVWLHDGRPILKLRGVDSISDAQALAGAEIRLPVEERTPLEAGEFYQADLIGCTVVERGGETLGRVSGWREYGGPALVAVETPDGGEMLIPFARSICVEIDVAARRIVVDLPEGLKELNR